VYVVLHDAPQLRLSGHEALDEAAGSSGLDPLLLMEMLEVSEAVDGCMTEDELMVISKENNVKSRQVIDQLSRAFKAECVEWCIGPCVCHLTIVFCRDHEAALKWTVRLRYLQRIDEAVLEWSPKE
jgi:hypothetical protein